jgi:L-threonine kinase
VNGAHFLVTCPVNLYSTVSVMLYPGKPTIVGPVDCPKSVEAVRATLAYLGREEIGAKLIIRSLLPRRKGMASSTADVAGAIAATALALRVHLSPIEIAQLALSIEPSDGIMFPGIALFDHRHGLLYEDLGLPPPIEIAVLDFGGTVDTLEFNRVDRRAILCGMEAQFKESLELVRRGIALGEPSLVGKGATISAQLNQEILYKPELESAVEFATSVEAIGVNVAHSGAVIGILLDQRLRRGRTVLEQARRAFSGLEASYCLQLIGGGLKEVSRSLTASVRSDKSAVEDWCH